MTPDLRKKLADHMAANVGTRIMPKNYGRKIKSILKTARKQVQPLVDHEKQGEVWPQEK